MRRDPSQTVNQAPGFAGAHQHRARARVSLFESIQRSKLHGCPLLSSFLLSSWLPPVIFYSYDYTLGASAVTKIPKYTQAAPRRSVALGGDGRPFPRSRAATFTHFTARAWLSPHVRHEHARTRQSSPRTGESPRSGDERTRSERSARADGLVAGGGQAAGPRRSAGRAPRGEVGLLRPAPKPSALLSKARYNAPLRGGKTGKPLGSSVTANPEATGSLTVREN